MRKANGHRTPETWQRGAMGYVGDVDLRRLSTPRCCRKDHYSPEEKQTCWVQWLVFKKLTYVSAYLKCCSSPSSDIWQSVFFLLEDALRGTFFEVSLSHPGFCDGNPAISPPPPVYPISWNLVKLICLLKNSSSADTERVSGSWWGCCLSCTLGA